MDKIEPLLARIADDRNLPASSPKAPVADQRNAVFTGKSHLAIAIARALIRNGSRGRFYNIVDLVNRLETEHRNG